MAVPKHAIVRGVQALSQDTCKLDLEMAEDLGFVGGQYVIIDSQCLLPNGKAAKRAYSMITSDEDQRRFSLVVKKIGAGLCSNYLHGVKQGDELRFSGPWGKFQAPESLLGTGPVLFLATDTGITTTLGVLRSKKMAPLLDRVRVHWLRCDRDIMDPDLVKTWLGPVGSKLQVHDLPPVHHPERVAVGHALFDAARNACAPDHVFMAGDGDVLLPYARILYPEQAPDAWPKDRVSCFFNMPKKSTG